MRGPTPHSLAERSIHDAALVNPLLLTRDLLAEPDHRRLRMVQPQRDVDVVQGHIDIAALIGVHRVKIVVVGDAFAAE